MMVQTIDRIQDRRLVHSGINWQQFKSIQVGFADSPGIRLFYYKGEVEILAVSQDHEFFSRTICTLLCLYCAYQQIEFSPTGSFSQEKPGVACAQADESYFIGRQRQTDSPPDLSIEVVFTSGNESKLNRYRALEVPEVWFWEDGVFALYHLRSEGYEKIPHSEVLPGLDLNLVSRCLLMASSIEAIQTFTEERQRAGGRRQKEEGRNIIFALCQKGLKPLNLFLKKRKNMYFEIRSARNTTSLLNPLNLFMGLPFCPLPSASCLLNRAIARELRA